MEHQAIVITGANGFIGRHLCDYFSLQGYTIIAAVRSNAKFLAKGIQSIELLSPAFDEYLKIHQPEFLIHSAGSASVANSFLACEEDFNNNVVLTEKVFDHLVRYSPQTKVIFLSSAAVYGNADKLPIVESTSVKPISPYGYHKLICEQLVRKYQEIFGIPSLIMRIFSVYGAGLRKQILWDVYQKSLVAKKLIFYGDGTEERDFIYITDLLKLVDILLKEATFNDEIVNVTSTESIQISDLVQLMLDKLGCNKPFEFNGEVKRGDPHSLIGISESVYTRSINWTPISQGVEHYINWLRTDESIL